MAARPTVRVDDEGSGLARLEVGRSHQDALHFQAITAPPSNQLCLSQVYGLQILVEICQALGLCRRRNRPDLVACDCTGCDAIQLALGIHLKILDYSLRLPKFFNPLSGQVRTIENRMGSFLKSEVHRFAI